MGCEGILGGGISFATARYCTLTTILKGHADKDRISSGVCFLKKMYLITFDYIEFN